MDKASMKKSDVLGEYAVMLRSDGRFSVVNIADLATTNGEPSAYAIHEDLSDALDALKHLEEEWGDVSIACAALMIPAVVRSGNEVPFSALNMPVEMQQKLNRWVARLEEAEG